MTNVRNDSAESDAGEGSTVPPESKLILNTSHLLPGDVLLFRPLKPNIVQRSISAATGSPYTHAAIYVGDGLIAESVVPDGVVESAIQDSIPGNRCVAVLRSQYVFSKNRAQELRKFVNEVLAREKRYNFADLVKFKSQSGAYFNDQFDFIRTNYGKVTSKSELAERSFFCSAFIVGCYAVVGIIDDTAQVAYQPEFFSPGHLHQDPTFGWLLGYLVPEGGSVPANDPPLATTLWSEQDWRWW